MLHLLSITLCWLESNSVWLWRELRLKCCQLCIQCSSFWGRCCRGGKCYLTMILNLPLMHRYQKRNCLEQNICLLVGQCSSSGKLLERYRIRSYQIWLWNLKAWTNTSNNYHVLPIDHLRLSRSLRYQHLAGPSTYQPECHGTSWEYVSRAGQCPKYQACNRQTLPYRCICHYILCLVWRQTSNMDYPIRIRKVDPRTNFCQHHQIWHRKERFHHYMLSCDPG